MVSGIDVSHYNGVIDWQKVAQSGVKFAYIKCTDGPTFLDPQWAFNTTRAQLAGVKIGSYHFLRPGVKADQLNTFIHMQRVVNVLTPDDLPPCLDVEIPGELPVFECAQRIVDELKRFPVIYTNPATGVWLPDVEKYPLWIADYGEVLSPTPVVVEPWAVWAFWQHTDKGTVPGIEGNVDLDWFNGDQAEFELFLEQSKGLPT